MQHTRTTPSAVWYRQPYVWLVIFFPLSAVVAGFYTFYLAVASDDGLVVDDYYKQGLQINMKLERDKLATQYGLQANLQFSYETKRTRLYLNKTQADYPYPTEIKLSFHNRTRAGADQFVTLKHIGQGTYEGNFTTPDKGLWYVALEADNWRLLKSARFPDTQQIQITPTELN